MFHRFARHVKEGFIGVARHLGMAVSSASAVTITLVLISVFLVLTWNLQTVTNSIESSINIVVSIDYEASGNKAIIEKEILKVPGVVSTEYRSREEEFNFYAQMQGEEEKAFYEQYRSSNPFHDVFLVTVEDGLKIEDITKSLEGINGVYGVYDGGTNTYTLMTVFSNVRIFGTALVVALCLLATYLVYNTIKITIASRKDEIWIMRNVGAKNGYIRAPFLVEGVIIGGLGSIIPIVLSIVLYYLIYQNLGGTLFGAFAIVAPFPFILYISLILFLIGIGVGFIGSYISVCKYLKLRR